MKPTSLLGAVRIKRCGDQRKAQIWLLDPHHDKTFCHTQQCPLMVLILIGSNIFIKLHIPLSPPWIAAKMFGTKILKNFKHIVDIRNSPSCTFHHI